MSTSQHLIHDDLCYRDHFSLRSLQDMKSADWGRLDYSEALIFGLNLVEKESWGRFANHPSIASVSSRTIRKVDSF